VQQCYRKLLCDLQYAFIIVDPLGKYFFKTGFLPSLPQAGVSLSLQESKENSFRESRSLLVCRQAGGVGGSPGCRSGVDVSHALPLSFPCFLSHARSSF